MASILEQYEHEQQTGGNLPSSRQILADEPVSVVLIFLFVHYFFVVVKCMSIV